MYQFCRLQITLPNMITLVTNYFSVKLQVQYPWVLEGFHVLGTLNPFWRNARNFSSDNIKGTRSCGWDALLSGTTVESVHNIQQNTLEESQLMLTEAHLGNQRNEDVVRSKAPAVMKNQVSSSSSVVQSIILKKDKIFAGTVHIFYLRNFAQHFGNHVGRKL